MADLSSLTPEQMRLLQQLGMMRGLGDMGASTASSDGPIAANVSNYTIAPDQNMTIGNVSGGVPFDGGNIRGGVSFQQMNTRGNKSSAVVPNVGVNVGPLNAMYSAAITPQGVQQSAGGGIDFGPFAVNYQRGFGNERAKPTDSFGVSAPIGPAVLNAMVTSGKGIPTQYTGGVSIPGLLNGNLDVAASYSPEDKKKAIYGRFSKRF